VCAGLTPANGAGLLLRKWQVTSTIVGLTSAHNLIRDVDALGTNLSAELLASEIDKIRWDIRDPRRCNTECKIATVRVS
jgi:aryl-alcohol dehydrogenase-like predicted oxidoreductase